MKGVILAGGKGTRLWPLTAAVNKHVLPVADRPMIHWSMDMAAALGADRLVVVTEVHHQRQVDAAASLHPNYSHMYTQRGANGVPSAIGCAEPWFEWGLPEELFVVALGDNMVLNLDALPPVVDRPTMFTIMMPGTQASDKFGVYDPFTNTVTEKATFTTDDPVPVSIGLYVLPATVFQLIPDLVFSNRCETEMADLLNILLESHGMQVICLPDDAAWIDAGTSPAALMAAGVVAVAIRSDNPDSTFPANVIGMLQGAIPE